MSRVQVVSLLVLGALSLTAGRADCKRRLYEGYSVLRCQPQTEDQLAKLRSLEGAAAAAAGNARNFGVQFWKEPAAVNGTVDVMVEPDYKDELARKLRLWGVPNGEIISDVAALIAATTPARQASHQNGTMQTRLLSPEQYHTQYHSYADIEAKLAEVAARDPRVTLETFGQTSEGRNMHLVKVSSDPAAKKPVILIDAGHHAREWISHATAIYLLESLVSGNLLRQLARQATAECRTRRCRRARRARLSLDRYDFWLVPVVNPDGYEYTHNTDRLWRKTRSRTACWWSGGVDPNRNYPFHWMEAGASRSACSDVYAGPKPQSEPEVRAMVALMDANKERFVMYLSLHAYSQVVLSPYGYGRVYPDNYAELGEVASAWIESVRELRGTKYAFGTSAILLYPAAGGSDDYAHGAAGIRFAYTIELPDTGRHGFMLPQSEIVPVGQEAVLGVRAMIQTMDRIRRRAAGDSEFMPNEQLESTEAPLEVEERANSSKRARRSAWNWAEN